MRRFLVIMGVVSVVPLFWSLRGANPYSVKDELITPKRMFIQVCFFFIKCIKKLFQEIVLFLILGHTSKSLLTFLSRFSFYSSLFQKLECTNSSFQNPKSSWRGPVKQGLTIHLYLHLPFSSFFHPSILPSTCLDVFSDWITNFSEYF